jgi:hypothetical protein
MSPMLRSLSLNFKQDCIVSCEECEAEFQNLRGLRLHEGRVHNVSDKNIKCCECTRMFKSKYSLRIHVKQVHDKATRETCTKCGKVLYNKYMLKKHMKKNHPPTANIG